jgi:hypothetical protein
VGLPVLPGDAPFSIDSRMRRLSYFSLSIRPYATLRLLAQVSSCSLTISRAAATVALLVTDGSDELLGESICHSCGWWGRQIRHRW